jgi:hypothetical protein
VRDTNWSALGSAAVDAAQGAASRIGSVNSAEMAVSAAISVPDAIPVVVPDVAVDKPKVDVSAKEAEQAKVAKLRAETNVDAPLAPSPKITEVPKRLV